MSLDFSIVIPYLHALGIGLWTTVRLSLICFFLGGVLGFAIAQARISKFATVRWPAQLYVEFFRGTPVLIQLFWIFYCLPLLIGIELSNFASAILSLTLYAGAIMSESFRSGQKSVGREQYDACHALGLSAWHRSIHVTLPQTVLRSIPILLSNGVSLFKESALISAVGMAELMFIGTTISNKTGRPVEILTTVALIYFVVAFPLTRIVALLERRVLLRFSS